MSTDLRAAIAGHLAERRARGYRLEGRERLLGAFLDSLDARGQTRITVPAAITFATAPAGTTRAWHAQRLAAVRSFAGYVHALDPAAADPVPGGLIPGRTARRVPYLYSGEETARLMAAAGTLPSPVLAASMRTLIGLLANTGLFSRGEDRCKSGVLADRAGSGVIIHPPSPRHVVVHVAVHAGRASEQRQQRAPHQRDVLQKLPAERSGATSCDRLRTPGEGVRSGEVFALDVGDLDTEAQVLTVTGKYGRKRLIALHPSAAGALPDYLRFREQHAADGTTALFIGQAGRRLGRSMAYPAFRSLTAGCGLEPQPGCRSPRLHDFRHSFRRQHPHRRTPPGP